MQWQLATTYLRHLPNWIFATWSRFEASPVHWLSFGHFHLYCYTKLILHLSIGLPNGIIVGNTTCWPPVKPPFVLLLHTSFSDLKILYRSKLCWLVVGAVTCGYHSAVYFGVQEGIVRVCHEYWCCNSLGELWIGCVSLSVHWIALLWLYPPTG